MAYFILPDRPHPPALLDALIRQAGVVSRRHASGAAWLVGTPGPADEHHIEACDKTVRIRGTLSTSSHVFWATVHGIPVAASGQAGLAAALDARPDPERVALGLCSNLPSWPFRLAPWWEGVHTVAPGATLVLPAAGTPTVRDATLPPCDGPEDPEEAGRLVAAGLMTVVADEVAVGSLGVDVSGGMDSTALAFLVHRAATDAVYVHAPTDDPTNPDTDFARRAATAMGVDLLELESFSRSTDAFGRAAGQWGREGVPRWHANAPHLRALFAALLARGVARHLSGIGGDELFLPLPALALAQAARGQRRAGWMALARLAVGQRWPVLATLRAAHGRGYPHELRHRTTAPASVPDDALGWAPGFAVSPFSSTATRDAVRDQLVGAASTVAPHFPDRARHQVLEGLVFQGEVVRQVNAALGDVAWRAPFLDDRLVATVLRLPPGASRGSDLKPLLARATAGVVPRWLMERREKGEYGADLYADLRRSRAGLRDLFADSWLADHGLIDLKAVRAAIDAPVLGAEQVFDLEHVVAVERWMKEVAA